MGLPHTKAPSSVYGSMLGDMTYYDDFNDGNEVIDNGGKFSATGNQAQWLITVIDSDGDGAHTITPADAEPGGAVRILNNVDALDQIQGQLNGEAWTPRAGKDIFVEARLKISDADDERWAFGLATTDTTVFDLTASGIDDIITSTEFVGFIQDTEDGNIDYAVANGHTAGDGNSTSGDTGVNTADDTYVNLSFHIKGTESVSFYVNGGLKATVKQNIPANDDMTLTWMIANDGSNDRSTGAILHIDAILGSLAR